MRMLTAFCKLGCLAAVVSSLICTDQGIARPRSLPGWAWRNLPIEKSAIDGRPCANFGGSWAGTCSDSEGDTIRDWLKIEQDHCTWFVFEGDGFRHDVEVSGMYREGSTSFVNTEALDFNGTSDWDVARRVLTVRTNAYMKLFSHNTVGSINEVDHYSLVDGRLHWRSEYKGESIRDGVPSEWSGWENCVFDKTTP